MYPRKFVPLLFFAVATLTIVQLTEADRNIDDYLVTKKDGKLRYCGRHLANVLELLCKGLYNTMFKRDQANLDDYPSYDDSNPFRSRSSARAMMMGRFGNGRFRRNSRGVNDECCAKACSTEELSSYCAAPP